MSRESFYVQSFSLTECIVIVRVRKYRVVCLSVCVSVCVCASQYGLTLLQLAMFQASGILDLCFNEIHTFNAKFRKTNLTNIRIQHSSCPFDVYLQCNYYFLLFLVVRPRKTFSTARPQTWPVVVKGLTTEPISVKLSKSGPQQVYM